MATEGYLRYAVSRRTVVALGVAISLGLAASRADADAGDIALGRLSYFDRGTAGMPDFAFAGGCGTAATMGAGCLPDNQLFFNLVNELGGALAPSLLAPARTIGYGGLYFGIEESISNINGGGEYWRRGTVGTDRDLAMMRGTATVRESLPSVLAVQRLHVRKGFPYGFELGLQTSWVADSSMVALGLDIRWAPFEGFRTGIGYLPDLAFRGAVNTLVGNPQLYLTIVSVDASLSKPFTLGGMSVLTPFLGAQALMILGDSTVVDGTPTRSNYQECTRREVQFDPPPPATPTGSHLGCTAGTMPEGIANDSHNDFVFTPVRLLRWRLFGGLQFRFGIFTLSGEFAIDIVRPSFMTDPNANSPGGRPNATGGRDPITITQTNQWMTTIGLGVTFN
jgi:hypothetical protein